MQDPHSIGCNVRTKAKTRAVGIGAVPHAVLGSLQRVSHSRVACSAMSYIWCCRSFVYHTVLTHKTQTRLGSDSGTNPRSLGENQHISGANATQTTERLKFRNITNHERHDPGESIKEMEGGKQKEPGKMSTAKPHRQHEAHGVDIIS